MKMISVVLNIDKTILSFFCQEFFSFYFFSMNTNNNKFLLSTFVCKSGSIVHRINLKKGKTFVQKCVFDLVDAIHHSCCQQKNVFIKRILLSHSKKETRNTQGWWNPRGAEGVFDPPLRFWQVLTCFY